MFRKQNSSSHPLEFELVSSLDGVSPVYGASPAVGISKNGGSFLAPAGAVTEQTLDAPTGLMVTPTGMAGSTTYGYRVAALNAAGTTLAGTEVTTTTGNATLSGANHNALSWNAVAGASSYNVYGRTAGAELFLANVATSTYNDTGAASPAGALPSINSTSGGWYQVAANATDTDTLGPLKLRATATGANAAREVWLVVAFDPDTNWITAGSGAGQINPDGTGAVPVAFSTALPGTPAAGSVGEALKNADKLTFNGVLVQADARDFLGQPVILDANNLPNVNVKDVNGSVVVPVNLPAVDGAGRVTLAPAGLDAIDAENGIVATTTLDINGRQTTVNLRIPI